MVSGNSKMRKKIASVLVSGPIHELLKKELQKFKPVIQFNNEQSKDHPMIVDIIAEGEDHKVMAVDCFAMGFMTAVNAFRDKKLF